MNYCSIEDAWGSKCNQISNQYKNYMVDKNYTEPEPMETNQNIKIPKNNIQLEKNIESFNNTNINAISNTKKFKIMDDNDHHLDELYDCNSFITHMRNCRKCHNKMRNYFRPKLVENFQDIIEDNRDTIVLILMGISILLFFNLINNMTK
jgi:hypothetical protein